MASGAISVEGVSGYDESACDRAGRNGVRKMEEGGSLTAIEHR